MKRNDHGWKLVSDSGCSLLVPDGPDGLAGIDIDIDHAEVPFTISVDNTDYIDEPGIDIEKMLEHIANCRSGGRTSCPSPHAWLEAWGDAENVIAFTLSAALSGSYNSAIAARHMALEKNPGRNIAVINTCGAGQLPVPPSVDTNIFNLTAEEKKARHIHSLPANLREATLAMSESDFMKEAVGSHIFERYTSAKMDEWNEYTRQVTDWEISNYLYKV